MVREGIPFVLLPVAIAAAFGFFGWWPVAVLFAAIALFMLYFFRDPARVIPANERIIVSAADGRVTRVEDRDDGSPAR